MARTRRPKLVQLSLFRHGGSRKGAGRKPNGPHRLALHEPRERVVERNPLHVTTHLVEGLPSLRSERMLALLRTTLAQGSDRFGFRLIEYAILSNHLHFLVEAPDAKTLGRGMKGLLVRVARALNRAWGRKGAVIRDRFVARSLKSPGAVRKALVYVLQNAKHHGARILGIDACSSGPWFQGWIDRTARADRALPNARSWLLSFGWKRNGLISTREVPAGGLDIEPSELLRV